MRESSPYLVTIAIPAFKAKYLREAISSALNQTYKNIEVIVVDDKSPEDLKPIVLSFKDPRLRYFANEENLGGHNIVLNWNRCLSFANGDFFCLLCDDDIYEPDFIAEMLSFVEKYPQVKVFRSRVKMIDGGGNLVDYYPTSPEFETMVDYAFHKEKNLRQQTVSEFMLRTSHIRELGGYVQMPVGWESDVASIYIFGEKDGIVSSSKSLVAFRQSGINISTNGYFMIEKMAALNQFSRIINGLLGNNCDDHRYSELILRWRKIKVDQLKFEYLRNSSWRDIHYFWKNRTSSEVQIVSNVFGLALIYRMGYAVINGVRRLF